MCGTTDSTHSSLFKVNVHIRGIWANSIAQLSLGLENLRKKFFFLSHLESRAWRHDAHCCPLQDILFFSQTRQISCSVVSDSLQPHESHHARSPCPSPTPGVHSDSRPSSQGCHPAISCPQSLPASETFPMSQLFTWGGRSTGVSALASSLPKNTQTDLL